VGLLLLIPMIVLFVPLAVVTQVLDGIEQTGPRGTVGALGMLCLITGFAFQIVGVWAR
jgi:hypothetical protein